MTFYEKLLGYFHLSEKQFLFLSRDITLSDLPKPTHFTQMEKVVQRIQLAMKNKEKIMVYGDYDCDGVMATSILVKTFFLLGFPVGYYLPSRYIDGYGLNASKVIEIAKKGYSLIITVDNGITANEAVENARLLGVDVIVTDHHEKAAILPSSFAILHPVLFNDDPSYSCGAYVALMLSSALLGKFDDYLVSLAGIATISDMMPLLGVNRDLVRLTINLVNEHHFPQLKYLMEGQEIDEKEIGMRLAPKINAVGRIVENININRLVKYFTSDDLSEIKKLAEWITEINENRKTLMKESLSIQAIDFDLCSAIVLLTEEKEGLIGLIANRLLNQFHKPVVVFTADSVDHEILKGSARSQEGFNITKAFQSLEHLLIKSGGHDMAGGLSIRRDDFLTFKNSFEALAQTHPIEAQKTETLEIDLIDLNYENYSILRSFGPFGMQFTSPRFIIRNVQTNQLKFVSSGHHLSTALGRNIKLLGFNLEESKIKTFNKIDLLGDFEINNYKNQRSLIYKITSFLPTID